MTFAPASRAALYRQATHAAFLGLGINAALGLAKATGGWLGGSFALIADAVNSFSDVLTSAVVIVALRFAQKPADEHHPYGHTRLEGIAALNVSLLIIISALFIGWEAIQRLGTARAIPPLWTLWIAGANVLIKESLYHYKLRISRRTRSLVILANAWDHRSDALSALAVLVGLALLRWGGPRYQSADAVAALVVVCVIVIAGISLMHKTASELLDRQADDDLIVAVRAAAEGVAGVRAIEKMWMRKTGLEYLVDIHVQVDPLTSIRVAHEIGHAVKDHLLHTYPHVRDVLVHLEPHERGTDRESSQVTKTPH